MANWRIVPIITFASARRELSTTLEYWVKPKVARMPKMTITTINSSKVKDLKEGFSCAVELLFMLGLVRGIGFLFKCPEKFTYPALRDRKF